MSVETIMVEREPFGRARLAGRALKALWELGQSGRPVAGAERPPAEPEVQPGPPAWTKPPARAAYPVRDTPRPKVAVELDRSAVPHLDRVMRHTERAPWEGEGIEIWLTVDEGPATGGSLLAVHIGGERVGSLDGEAAELFRPIMQAAAQRDEDPRVQARLIRIPGDMPYLLQLGLPEGGRP